MIKTRTLKTEVGRGEAHLLNIVEKISSWHQLTPFIVSLPSPARTFFFLGQMSDGQGGRIEHWASQPWVLGWVFRHITWARWMWSSLEVLWRRTGPQVLNSIQKWGYLPSPTQEIGGYSHWGSVTLGAYDDKTGLMLARYLDFQPILATLKLSQKLVAHWVEVSDTNSSFLKVPKRRGRWSDMKTGD